MAGSGVKILNHPAPPAFKESVKVGEQVFYSRAKDLVGERNPRSHEFSVQVRWFDNDTTGHGLGLAALVSLTGAMLERSVKGGLVVVGHLSLGGSVDTLVHPVAIAELAVEKGASILLMPVTARRNLVDLPDDLATKISIEFYRDAAEAVGKSLMD